MPVSPPHLIRFARVALAAIGLLGGLGSAAAAPSPVTQAVARSLQQYEAGDYPGVTATLRPLVDGNSIADPTDQAQALRIYGIACVLTGQALAAEAALLRWLRLDPRARLDPTLTRPEAVSFFERLREAHRAELIAEVERRRPRSIAVNLIPPAGQYQNREVRKFGVLLAAELALSALSLATFLTLNHDQRPDGTFANYPRAEALRGVNWGSTFALAGVLLYGIIDGFVMFRRLRDEARRDEDGLRSATAPLAGPF